MGAGAVSYGHFSPSHKSAPGLGGKLNGQIDAIVRDWHKHGIGVVREKGKR
jgi:hypothetical protein